MPYVGINKLLKHRVEPIGFEDFSEGTDDDTVEDSTIFSTYAIQNRDERTRTRRERTQLFVRVRSNMNEHEH